MSQQEQDCNSNIACSAGQTTSTPGSRKCSCSRNMFLKPTRCKHCRCRCRRKSSCSKNASQKSLFSGDEHWTKVLQANDTTESACYKCHRCRKRRHSCSKQHAITAGEKLSPNNNNTNVFSSLYSRFCRWVATAKHNAAKKKCDTCNDHHHHHHQRHLSGQTSCGECSRYNSFNGVNSISIPAYEYDLLSPYCNASSVSLEDNDRFRSRCSTCSSANSIAVYSTSSGISDCYFSLSSPASTVTTPTSDIDVPCFPSPDRHRSHDGGSGGCGEGEGSGDRRCVAPRVFDFLQTTSTRTLNRKERLSLSHSIGRKLCIVKQSSFPERDDDSPIWATWPQMGRKLFENANEEDDLSLNGSVYGDYFEEDDNKGDEQTDRDISSVLRDTLGECSIVYENLEFGDCIQTGRKCNVYRGKWYGDVVIHEYLRNNEQGLAEFWEEVAQLRMIRHENIALFMGACIEPPHLAIVTCLGKGSSLFEQIHLKHSRMSLHTRLHIARQVAQGLGYLHARGIVMRFMNSRNIYLESKVKLTLLDDGSPDVKHERATHSCLKRGYLTYQAPEMLSTMRVSPPELEWTQPYAMKTDVFAFGTILFELLSDKFPYHRVSPESIIWQVSSGKRQTLQNVKSSESLKCLIEECWSHAPNDRPGCAYVSACISKELQKNHSTIHKKHSSSEPETLNRSGTSYSGLSSLFG